MATKRKKAKPVRRQQERKKMAKKHDEPERSVPRHTEAVEEDSGAKGSRLSDKPITATPEEIDRAVEHMSQTFAAAVPEEALREGQYELPADDPLRRLKTKIPDGSYRVAGHDWVLDFGGGCLVGVTRVTEDTSPSSYTSVPQPRS